MTAVYFKLDENRNVIKEFYNLYYSIFDNNFANEVNYVAVNCFPIFFFDEILKKEILEYIKSNIQDDNTRIYFDNINEGHIYACLPGIHEIIDILNLNSEKCYFITGAIDSKEIYTDYCVKNNIANKINIIPVVAWARSLRFSSNMEKVKEHEFIIEPKEKLFLCFNRIFRSHRAALLSLLYNKNLVDQSYYSFSPLGSINTVKNNVSEKLYDLVSEEYNKHINDLPLILNNPDYNPSNNIQENDLVYFRNSYFSLVTETFFFSRIDRYVDEHAVFFSEKIFKPIICKHPFILVGRPKSLECLRKLGYRTFHSFIDESYDLIENDEERLLAIVNEVERLSKKTTEEWIEFLTSVKEIVNYNFDVIINKSLEDFIVKF